MTQAPSSYAPPTTHNLLLTAHYVRLTNFISANVTGFTG